MSEAVSENEAVSESVDAFRVLVPQAHHLVDAAREVRFDPSPAGPIDDDDANRFARLRDQAIDASSRLDTALAAGDITWARASLETLAMKFAYPMTEAGVDWDALIPQFTRAEQEFRRTYTGLRPRLAPSDPDVAAAVARELPALTGLTEA